MSYRAGPWAYELMASIRFFEDNDDYFNGRLLEQNPLWSLQGHLIYNFTKGRWISLNANFYRGGETRVDGDSKDNYVENSRMGHNLFHACDCAQQPQVLREHGGYQSHRQRFRQHRCRMAVSLLMQRSHRRPGAGSAAPSSRAFSRA